MSTQADFLAGEVENLTIDMHGRLLLGPRVTPAGDSTTPFLWRLVTGPDGAIMHAEMEYADGVIMLGRPGTDYKSPKRIGRNTQSLYVYVDDVDKHFQHSKASGAKVFEDPADQFYGDRRYGAEDPEGHQWYFATHVRDPSPEEMKPPA